MMEKMIIKYTYTAWQGVHVKPAARLLAIAQYKVLLYVTANMVQFIFVL